MAQTKRKRRTKHRGNAAGVVESRGRTGRKPTAAEKSGKAGDAARAKEKRLDRYNRPPTWRGAALRALVAAVLMVALSLLLFAKKNPGEAFALFPVVLLLYVPISYYTDQWLYKRRQRNKAKRGGGTAASR
jgi:hypothetical protein